MMDVYFDNAATTRVYEPAAELVTSLMLNEFGNPSSLHDKGVEAERYVRGARETFASLLKLKDNELIFTSGATESNNMAIFGAARARRRYGRHIITTAIEHASVYNPMKELERQGYELTVLPVGSSGLVDPEAVRSAVRPDTILVSVMGVNNEIGTIEPIADIVKAVKETNPETLIHVDAVQTFGKVRFYPSRLGIDMMSVSGHKFHGPKGTGLLWVRGGVRIEPLIYGGGQQKGMRSGTDNVPGWAGMAKAAQLEFENFDDKVAGLYDLREYFIDQVLQIKGTAVNGGLRPGSFTVQEDPLACAAPHIVSVSFDDVRAEVLLHAMAEKGVSISAGSACSSNHPDISRTLKAIGVPKEHLDSTVRFSFSFDSDREQVDYCINALKEVLPVLRRYVPGGRKKRR